MSRTQKFLLTETKTTSRWSKLLLPGGLWLTETQTNQKKKKYPCFAKRSPLAKNQKQSGESTHSTCCIFPLSVVFGQLFGCWKYQPPVSKEPPVLAYLSDSHVAKSEILLQ